MKGVRSKRKASYGFQVATSTASRNPSRVGFTRDHIVPVSFGFKHDIPPVLMGSPENIQYIGLNANIQKGQRMTEKGIRVLRSWAKHDPRFADLADFYEYKLMVTR